MQVREYGNYIRINLNEDLTSFINTIELYKPSMLLPTNNQPPVVITTAEGLVVGNSDIVVGSKTFLAGQYLQYKIAEGLIDESGVWNAIATVKDNVATSFRITKRIQFNVSK